MTRALALSVLLAACAATKPAPLRLRRVILYQNGIGYFERTGHLAGSKLRLSFARPELDDVLKTLTVVDRLGGSVATVDVPTSSDADRTISIGVRLGAVRDHDLLVGYAVPTPMWKATYRLVLDDRAPASLLQGWAMVNNASRDDWEGVSLTLATGAPMSFGGDLSKPTYVRRPDASGTLVAPTVLGPIDAETTTAVDGDRDGVLDVDDNCPDAPAMAGEDDGCPEPGRTIHSDTQLVVLEPITFARGEAALDGAATEVVAAIAETLNDNAEITRLEIGGHAAADEPEAWSLSSRRAVVVRDALIARGVAADRLVLAPYGASQLIDQQVPARNRRVELLILARAAAGAPSASQPVATAATIRASTRARTRPATVAGSVRYVLSDPVSIRRGASTMVSILNQPVTGEDVFLFKPDVNGPGSDRHPFRAVRLVNTSGFTLEPGPIAIFARGSFVGDTLIGRLAVDDTAWIPYALEGGTTVTATAGDHERPLRLVSIAKGVVTVENTALRTTRYTIATGRESARVIYIRHAKTPGFVAPELPPQTIDQGDAYLVPLPLAAAKTSVLVIEERQPRRRMIALTGTQHLELEAYLDGAPAAAVARVRAVLALRRDLATTEDGLAALRSRLADLAARANEIRESLKSIERVRADELRRHLVASLVQTTAETETVAKTLYARSEALWTQRTRLADALRDLSLDDQP